MKDKIDICYLCGKPLDPENISRDDVPPKQIYAKRIRKAYNLNQLIRLPAHTECNQSYQKDEDYFIVSLVPTAIESYTGKAVLDDVGQQFKRPQGRRLGQKIINEYGRIILPDGRITKHFDGNRIGRIIWKIARGLFFYETERFLPEDTPYELRVFSDKSDLDFFQEPKPFFYYIADLPSKGKYPAVFDYKYRSLPTDDDPHLWVWGLYFWQNTIICEIDFFDPKSSEEKFREALTNSIT